MDEVWEHITPPNLRHLTPTAPPSAGMNLPDFLHRDPYTGGGGFSFGCRSSPPPVTALSLNSSSGTTSQLLQSDHSKLASVSSSCLGKKRANPGNNGDDAAGELRHKRLIKNRESAARSRARRQAYTDDLEQKMNELKKENAKLRRELEKVGFTEETATTDAQNQQHSRKGNCLQRTLTAPF